MPSPGDIVQFSIYEASYLHASCGQLLSQDRSSHGQWWWVTLVDGPERDQRVLVRETWIIR